VGNGKYFIENGAAFGEQRPCTTSIAAQAWKFCTERKGVLIASQQ